MYNQECLPALEKSFHYRKLFSERQLKATFPDRNLKLAMDQKSLLDMDFSELNKLFEEDRWKNTPGGTVDLIMVRYNL